MAIETELANARFETGSEEGSYRLAVRGVVEEKETGAWIRLLTTLNHEIKNSVTPTRKRSYSCSKIVGICLCGNV